MVCPADETDALGTSREALLAQGINEAQAGAVMTSLAAVRTNPAHESLPLHAPFATTAKEDEGQEEDEEDEEGEEKGCWEAGGEEEGMEEEYTRNLASRLEKAPAAAPSGGMDKGAKIGGDDVAGVGPRAFLRWFSSFAAAGDACSGNEPCKGSLLTIYILLIGMKYAVCPY